MRKRTLKTTIFGLIAFCVASAATASETPKVEGEGVALVIKAVRIVEAREKQEAWRGVQRGQQLNSGTQVRTGEQSFSILKFADNSVIRVAESSEIVVRGDKDKTNAMNKTIELNLGKVGFNIKKQGANEQFRFVSPTSVASIKGTSGYFSPNSLLILEGSASFGLADGTTMQDVGAGQIGEVVNGQVQVRQATPEELDEARRVLAEINERIIIKLRDANGNIREIEIR